MRDLVLFYLRFRRSPPIGFSRGAIVLYGESQNRFLSLPPRKKYERHTCLYTGCQRTYRVYLERNLRGEELQRILIFQEASPPPSDNCVYIIIMGVCVSAWEHDGFERKRKGGGKRRKKKTRRGSQATDARLSAASRFATAAIRNVARWKSRGLKRNETTAYSISQTHCRPACVRQARVCTRTHTRASRHANNTAAWSQWRPGMKYDA